MRKIQVLLSTFNGEKYLVEQIESIMRQKNVEVRLLVRDDGSTDSTYEILKGYSEKNTNIQIYQNRNLGPKKSFLDLIQNSDDSSEFFAFADQDDIWLERKLDTGIEFLDTLKESLYISKTNLVNSDLSSIGIDQYDSFAYSFDRVLVKNNGVGCTMVFNKKLKDLINKVDYGLLSDKPLHDHWIYMICLSVGGVVSYDNQPRILYRQHAENVVGGRTDFLSKIKGNGLFSNERTRYKYAIELYKNYSNYMGNEQLKLLKQVVDYDQSIKKTLELALSFSLKGSNVFESAIIFLTLILRKF